MNRYILFSIVLILSVHVSAGANVNSGYSIQPVIFAAGDTPFSLPDLDYVSLVNSNFKTVQSFYSDQLDGKTFSVNPAIFYRSPSFTYDLILSGGPERYFSVTGVLESLVAYDLPACNNHTVYFLISPTPEIPTGMFGSEWRGCDYINPGMASIGGYTGVLPASSDWWSDDLLEQQGIIAHELGHILGARCIGICDEWGHPRDYLVDDIMFAWWSFGIGGTFSASERAGLLESPFISDQSVNKEKKYNKKFGTIRGRARSHNS